MPAVKNTPTPAEISAATKAMAIVADGLIDQGFNVLVPAWESSCLLKVTNAPGALSELTIAADGSVTWEYRCLDGEQHDGAQLACVILGLLGTEVPRCYEPLVGEYPRVSPDGALGALLSELGMQMTSEILDAADRYAETTVTNPAQVLRGTVQLARGGAVWWDCQLSDPSASVDGVDLSEIVATISRVLGRLQSDRCCWSQPEGEPASGEPGE
jgi:hypothetical protein